MIAHDRAGAHKRALSLDTKADVLIARGIVITGARARASKSAPCDDGDERFDAAVADAEAAPFINMRPFRGPLLLHLLLLLLFRLGAHARARSKALASNNMSNNTLTAPEQS